MPYRNKPGVCLQCGNPFLGFRKDSKFCSVPCQRQFQKGPGHPQWKGGRGLKQGYVFVHDAGSKERRKQEHILVAEKSVGCPLPPGAVVHHFDENPSNNSPENLFICPDRAFHMLLHARMRRMKDTGSFDLKRCLKCGEVKPISEFYKHSANWDGTINTCKPCHSKYAKDKYANRKSRNVNNVLATDHADTFNHNGPFPD